MSNPKCFHLSASSISAIKACPRRFQLGYREGIRPADDTDAQRVGTNWHTMHEVWHNAVEGEEWAAVTEHLNEAYGQCPVSKTMEEWDLERQVLLTCFIGYHWYWEEQPFEVLHSELSFDLPLHAPKTGLPLPLDRVKRVGKVDHIVQWNGAIGPVERKSTGSSIDPDSRYWEKLQKDTQVSMYALAIRDMAGAGLLPDEVLDHEAYDPDRLGNTIYDVWHKPTISLKWLTQADTEMLLSSGQYMEESFEVEAELRDEGEGKDAVKTGTVTVDGTELEVKAGKKGFAVRESPAMFAARLLQDIYERPEFYFQRREIARTDKQLQRFRTELFNIYEAQRLFDRHGVWYENENQCRATFTCQYVPICYGEGGAEAVCDGKTVPDGFNRIFTDVTINGLGVEE